MKKERCTESCESCDLNYGTEFAQPLQRIMSFVTNTHDHAAVWTFMEFVPNDPGTTSSKCTMEDRKGQWWLCTRDLYNTKEQAIKSLLVRDYYEADETVVFLFDN